MRYVTHYAQYPIYEPAEGGYYYSGMEARSSERMSKRKAKARMEQVWACCEKENEEVIAFYNGDETKLNGRLWLRDGYYFYRPHDPYETYRYIGTGELITIERKRGSLNKGWQPYC